MIHYEELIEKARKASEAYYNGIEIMSNKEFDDLVTEIQTIENETGEVADNSPTKTVGFAPVDSLPKFTHTVPALSLDKTKDANEIISKYKKGIAESGSDNNKVVLMWKLDGSTVQAYYKDGKLKHLVTRGNGEVGSDITHNAKAIGGIPITIPEEGEVVVRGEALMSYDDFERINATLLADEQYKNPRNLAAASIQLLDPNELMARNITVKAFNLVKIDGDYSTFSSRLNKLKDLKFNVVEHVVCSIDNLKEEIQNMSDLVADYPYPVDGLVAAIDNYEYSCRLERTEHHPHILNGYAFKWADETAETVLREIEWSPSRTGLLNPVAIFDPVELEGTTVKRASIHNVSILQKMKLHIGDRITVFKSNKIIPQIDTNLDADTHNDYTIDDLVEMTGCCPTCGSKVAINKSESNILTAFCPNIHCPEKMIGSFEHFCSREGMDIQGMSGETIKKLVENKFIAEYSDIFNLSKQPAIAYLPGFGKQSWQKLVAAADKAKHTTFVKFIVALGIPNIGKGQAKTLLKYINDNYDRLVSFAGYDGEYRPVKLLSYMHNKGFNFSQIPGFGMSIEFALDKWISDHLTIDHIQDSSTAEARLYNLLDFEDEFESSSSAVESSISGKSFCITGKLINFSNRQALVDKIESCGGKWVDSVSSKTDYLINNDTTSTSGKNKKAKELSIPIISEEEFLMLIGGI